MADKGGSKNVSFIIFKYDNRNWKQQAVPVRLKVCKKYCGSWRWLDLNSSDFVMVMSDDSSPTNSANTGWSLITNEDINNLTSIFKIFKFLFLVSSIIAIIYVGTKMVM